MNISYAVSVLALFVAATASTASSEPNQFQLSVRAYGKCLGYNGGIYHKGGQSVDAAVKSAAVTCKPDRQVVVLELAKIYMAKGKTDSQANIDAERDVAANEITLLENARQLLISNTNSKKP